MFALGDTVDALELQLNGLHSIVAGAQHELLREEGIEAGKEDHSNV